jgi:hypothetical protein
MDKNFDGDQEQKERGFVQFMSRHLVAMVGDYESYQPSGEILHRGMFVFSGFIIELHDRWFWTTAGHCLEDYLETPVRNGVMKILGSGFADYFGPDVKSQSNIPFTYQVGDGFYVQKPDLGLDFALVRLPELLRKNLEHNGVVPIIRKNWVYQDTLEFSLYRMLGFPSHLVTEPEYDEKGVLKPGTMQPVMLAINRIEQREAGVEAASAWFEGRIDPRIDIPSIEGMSGGPIFGFRRNDEGGWSYHVVALQSRWFKKQRIVHGCSLPVFAEAVFRGLGA